MQALLPMTENDTSISHPFTRGTSNKWWNQKFRSGGARLKDKIESKKLI